MCLIKRKFRKNDDENRYDDFIEEFKAEIKTPLRREDTDTNRIIILTKLDFSNKIFLASIT